MTIANDLILAWQHRGPIKDLAHKLDPKVTLHRSYLPFKIIYTFSDGSRLEAIGKGRHHSMKELTS